MSYYLPFDALPFRFHGQGTYLSSFPIRPRGQLPDGVYITSPACIGCMTRVYFVMVGYSEVHVLERTPALKLAAHEVRRQ